MTKTGLTLGKFAPLHRGHQSVIERALAENDHVIVVIYNAPETTTCPLPLRAGWIRQLFPAVEVIEAWDGPTTVSEDPNITALHDAYLTKLLADKKIDRFYSSEFYGEHVSKALEAEDCRMDPNRAIVAVSGTQIRNDPYAHRQFIDPVVYRDLITRVVLVGAPSTGKSTLAESLAKEYQTVWMPEYGREYWEQNQVERRLSLEQLVEIATEHRRREDELCLQANRYLFVDTDATTTMMFSQYYHGTADPALVDMTQSARARYDLCFLCDTDVPYDDTWDRSGEVHRGVFQKQIEADLILRKRPCVRLCGNLNRRMKCVSELLNRFDKFGSIADAM